MNDRMFPRYVRIDREAGELLSKLNSSPTSPFRGKKKRDIFMYAAAIGSYSGESKSSKNKADLNLFTDFPTKQTVLMDVIALKHFNYDLDKIVDGKEVVNVVEDYANARSKILYNMIVSSVSKSELESKIFDILKEAKLSE